MPGKWIFFKVIAFILLVGSLLTATAVVYQIYILYNDGIRDGAGTVNFSVTIFCFLCIAAYSILCIYLVQRCYPDRATGKSFNVVFLILQILFVILTLLMFLVCLYGASETIDNINNEAFRENFYSLIAIVFFAAIMTTVLIMSAKLRKLIKYNHKQRLTNSIENLGSNSITDLL